MRTVVVAVVILNFIAPCFASLDFNAVTGFSMSNNPSGSWQYGSEASPGSTFTLFTSQSTRGWCDDQGITSIWYNDSGMTKYDVEAGQLALHPNQQTRQLAVLRWTAPADSFYQVNATFFDNHYGMTDYYVLNNSTVIFSKSYTTAKEIFSSSLYLPAGSTLDIAVGPGNSGSLYSHTAVNAVITAIPEPLTISLLALGSLALTRKK